MDPVSIRIIITEKDRRKLELAKTMDDKEAAKKIAEDVLRDMFKKSGMLKPAWNELANSSLTGDDVQCYVEAIFLYGLRKLQDKEPHEVTYVWNEYERIWRRDLPKAAMDILSKTYFDIIRPASLAAFQGDLGDR